MAERAGIERLEDDVVAGIAAGEVVERPASAVKELVENSLDAGASRVEVRYDDGEITRIQVIDNGGGIPDDQIELALERHATSKIRRLDEVPEAATFGFRGEALAAIASASVLELETTSAGAEAATCVRVSGGRVVERKPAPPRPGTRIEVCDLFASVPARRKFLRSRTAEAASVADVVKRFALARPDVHLSLLHNGRKSLNVPAVPDLAARLRQVLGPEDTAGMLELDARLGSLRLRGRISPPGVSFGSSRRMSLFLGHRWIRDRMIFAAVMDGYQTHLLRGRYPALALFLDADPHSVDVNVHPAKMEVRFSDPDEVRRFVVEAVRDTLRRGASPLGRWGLDADEELQRRSRAILGQARDDHSGSQAGRVGDVGGVAEAPTQDRAALAPSDAPAGDGGSGLSGYVASDPAPRLNFVEQDQAEMQYGEFDKAGRLGRLLVLGQIFDGYIVGQADQELVLVDQHAAHECMLFERLMKEWENNDVPRQGVLVATPVHVGAAGVEAVEAYSEHLLKLGWEIDPFGEEEVAVRAVPAIAAGGDLEGTVEAVVADLCSLGSAATAERLAERVLATVACHSAVRVGKRLEATAARALVAELARVELRSSCPHGRPVARSLTRARIEGLFGR